MKLTLCLVSSFLFLGGFLFAQVPGMMTMQPASVPQGTDLGANNTVNAAGIALGNRVKLRGFVDFAYAYGDLNAPDGNATISSASNKDARFQTAADLDLLFDFSATRMSMEQLILSPTPLGVIVLAKIIAHWIVSGVPLVIVSPLLALSFYLPLEALPVFILAIALATPILSVLAAIGAALTVSLRGGGALIGLLMLPMMVPVFILDVQILQL